jgi:uncharacterized protein (DUF58 family)
MLGFLFSSPLIAVYAVLVFLYLFAEGIFFRRTVHVLEHLVELKTGPRNIETVTGRRHQVKTIITNHSDVGFRIVRFRRNLPREIHEEVGNMDLLVLPHEEQSIETTFEVRAPGRFEANKSTLAIERRARLFRQSVTLLDSVTITARPMIGSVNSLSGLSGLSDLAVDPTRRGPGTDLAGIRPANSLRDLQRIDWKATARTGKLMAREFYLERDPPIVLLIDASTLTRAERTAESPSDSLLGEVASLMANAQLARTPMGLVLYDDRAVIAKIQARLGVENRERILHTLLGKTKCASATMPTMQETRRPRASLARETRTMTRQLASQGKTEPFGELFSSFASAVLPFYRQAISRYPLRLRQEGVFKAFEAIRDLLEPALVIAISDGETNLDGLCEGSRQASTLNHRVIVALVVRFGKKVSAEWLSDLEKTGTRVVECTPEMLWDAVNAEMLQMSRRRFKEPAVPTPQTT